jgi:hypothetical protein
LTDLGTEKVTHKSYNFNKTLHTTRQEERQGKEGPLVVAEWEAGVLNIVTWLSVGSTGRESPHKSLCSKDLDDMSTSLLQGEELRSAHYARIA